MALPSTTPPLPEEAPENARDPSRQFHSRHATANKRTFSLRAIQTRWLRQPHQLSRRARLPHESEPSRSARYELAPRLQPDAKRSWPRVLLRHPTRMSHKLSAECLKDDDARVPEP